MIFDSCLVSATYNMTADVHNLAVTQNPKSKAISKVWTKDHSITCYAFGVLTDAVSDDASGKTFRFRYEENQYIKMHTGERLSKRQRITNIRDASGNLIWVEDDLPGSPATVFEVQGTTVRHDPFQNFVDYEVLLKRVEVQNA